MNRYVAQFAGKNNLRNLDTEVQIQHIMAGMVGCRLLYRELTAIVAAQFLALAEPETSEGPFVDSHEVDEETDVNSLNLNWREADLIGNTLSPNPRCGGKTVLELARMLLRLKEYTGKLRPK